MIIEIIEQLFLVHAGILGVIGFALLIIGSICGVYWRRKKQLARGNRRIHGYLTLVAYVLSVAHIGQGLAAYVQLREDIVELALLVHWIHIVLAIVFLLIFTKVLLDGYRGIMRCRDGYIVLILNGVLIVLGYLIRNLAFGEIIYPFL